MQGGGSALRAACYLAKLMPQVNEVGVYYSAPAGEVLGLLKAVGSGRKLARVHLYVDELGEGEAGLQWGDEWDLLPEIHHLEVFIEEGGMYVCVCMYVCVGPHPMGCLFLPYLQVGEQLLVIRGAIQQLLPDLGTEVGDNFSIDTDDMSDGMILTATRRS
mmetsp:Transcript_22249/g.63481  ORF Transcript_22249/g.63481 Transcript_22249/m.63481 type:complete len:160 (+) Transcript_22249:464-943(+)